MTPPDVLEKVKPFSEILINHEFRAFNAIAKKLRNVHVQAKVLDCMREWGQTRFIDLASAHGVAEISMAFYAGDGVVTKITPRSFLATEDLPFVIPPFRSVEIQDEGGNIVLTNHPYVSNKNITDADVDHLCSQLTALGIKFKRADARPDNIGRLPDGTLAVIDGNALLRTPEYDREKAREALDAWQEKIHAMFPAFYAPGFEYRQSDQTDFTLRSAYQMEEKSPQASSAHPRPNGSDSRRFWSLKHNPKKKAAHDTGNSLA